MRMLAYADALREATAQLLASDPRVFVFGQGLWSPWYVGKSMQNMEVEFGRERVLDSPVSENATTAAAVGAALAGRRPIVVHPRMDFMLLATDPIVNQAANWSYMFAGKLGVPIVIRAIINRGGEQAAQHSQAMQAMFAHVPGLKVVMPATPYDAKGLMIAAVRDGNPVLFIDDRWLYSRTGEVPEEMYEVPIGQGAIRRAGDDMTIVASSHVCQVAESAAVQLAGRGITADVIDLRSVKPWDADLVTASVRRTGRLLVVDGGWRTGGIAGEIVATVCERAHAALKAAPQRVALIDAPAPMNKAWEQAYYISEANIITCAEALVSGRAPFSALS